MMDAHRGGDEQTRAKLVRPYVGPVRQPESHAYVDLGARVHWHESGHFTARPAEPDRYLLTAHQPRSERGAGDGEARTRRAGTVHADDGHFSPAITPLVAVCPADGDPALPVQLP